MTVELLKTTGGPGHHIAGEMAEKIQMLVYAYSDRVPLALAVGVLEIVKAEIIQAQSEEG